MRNDMVRKLVDSINEATSNIPCWDAYARAGVKPATCNETIAPLPDGFKY